MEKNDCVSSFRYNYFIWFSWTTTAVELQYATIYVYIGVSMIKDEIVSKNV